MPLISFFQGKVEGEDFEEVSDLELVLEDCLALNLPQTYLQWHYRSKHESLIAFSNKRFYEGRMLTFPSADDRRSRIRFIKVNGYFDRGPTRTNRAEAEAIIEEVARRAFEPQAVEQAVGESRAQEPEFSTPDSIDATRCLYQTAVLDVKPLGAEEFAAMSARELAASIDAVLAVEAPIELSLLVRRISQAYGLSRAGSRVQYKCEQSLKYAKCKRVTQAGRVIVWRSNQDPKTYRVYRPAGDEADRRSADQVPLEEIAAAAVASLSGGAAMTPDQLAKAASVGLGYKRVAATIVDYMKRGISLAIRRGMVEKEGKWYRIANGLAEPEASSKAAAGTGGAESSHGEAVSQERRFLLDTMRVFIEDGEVTLDEAATLKLWMFTLKAMADDPDFKQVFALLDTVLEDGVVTPEESASLAELFDNMVREDEPKRTVLFGS